MLKQKLIKFRQAMTKKGRQGIAALLCASMLLPTVARGVPFCIADRPYVNGSWDDKYIEKAKSKRPEAYQSYEATGLAYNMTWFQSQHKQTPFWPFMWEHHLTQRPGRENPEYADFDNRHIYCVANHKPNYVLLPGMQAFKTAEYNTQELPNFAVGSSAEQKKFNFLMTAIACGYPIEYDAESTASVPDYLICQAIAWVATSEGQSGFAGVPEAEGSLIPYFQADLQTFKSSNYYQMFKNSFPSSVAPEIDSALHAKATDNMAIYYGASDHIDEVFYKIWMAAYYTTKLYPNWQENLTSTYTTIQKGDDGYYYAYVGLFDGEGPTALLNEVKREMNGDWEYVGTSSSITSDGSEQTSESFRSPTGEIPENGDICTYVWDDVNSISALLPLDETKAKLYTFEFLSGNEKNLVSGAKEAEFGTAQTFFSSVIEKSLTIHVRTDSPDPVLDKYKVVRHEHTENMNATYNVNLYKFDSETGKPLANSHWDILERFDDSQLENTSLDLTTDNLDDMYESALGSLNQTPWGTDDVESNYNGDMGVNTSESTLYNWGNDKKSQFKTWEWDEETHYDPCDRDDNVTGEDGKLYEIDSSSNITTDVAHTDRKSYTYDKGYCDGHPAPVIEYIVCDHDADEDCDCDERNQELHDEAWKAWYEEVEHCEQLVAEGGFFHCISTDGAAKKALEEDRDQFYKDFISLTYEYSAKEITAPKGYIRHGIHTDDIPMEWRCVTSSEYKDTEEATVLKHTDSSDAGDDTGSDTDTDTDDEIDTTSDDSLEDGISMASLTDEASIEESSETATESNATFVSGAVKIASIRALNENAEEKEETESTEEEIEEETEEDVTATDSDAKKEVPEISCVIH